MSLLFARQSIARSSSLRIATAQPLRFPAHTPRLFSTSNINMGVQAINSYDEFKKLINGDKPVVIDFWATWCGPCRVISPIFDKMSEGELGEKIVFAKVDVDEQAEISQECGIRAMPTFIIFKSGQKVESTMGAAPDKLQAMLVNFSKTL